MCKATTGTSLFTAALFVIARGCQQPKYLPTGNFLGQLWYLKYYAVIKNEKELYVLTEISEDSVKKAAYTVLHSMR